MLVCFCLLSVACMNSEKCGMPGVFLTRPFIPCRDKFFCVCTQRVMCRKVISQGVQSAILRGNQKHARCCARLFKKRGGSARQYRAAMRAACHKDQAQPIIKGLLFRVTMQIRADPFQKRVKPRREASVICRKREKNALRRKKALAQRCKIIFKRACPSLCTDVFTRPAGAEGICVQIDPINIFRTFGQCEHLEEARAVSIYACAEGGRGPKGLIHSSASHFQPD